MQFLVQGPVLSSRLRALALSSDTARWLPDVEVSFAGRSGGEGAPASRVDEADWEISRWDGHTGAGYRGESLLRAAPSPPRRPRAR